MHLASSDDLMFKHMIYFLCSLIIATCRGKEGRKYEYVRVSRVESYLYVFFNNGGNVGLEQTFHLTLPFL